MKFPLLKTLGAALSICAFSTLQAETFEVTVPLGNGPGSIRNQIANANPNDTIVFSSAINGQTIRLLGRIDIDKNLTIIGNGTEETVINGSSVDRIFEITGSEVSIQNVSLESGTVANEGGLISANSSGLSLNQVTFRNGVAAGNAATQGGGALFMDAGSLSISNCVFDNNNATGLSGSGGALLLLNDVAITISSSTFTGGSSNRAGGAIELNSSAANAMNISDCQFIDNSTGATPGNGGAIHITGNPNSTISNSIFQDNTASSEGGAVWNGSGIMMVMNCDFLENSADGIEANQGGGAIYNLSGSVNVSGGSKFEGNTATGAAGSGGAILNDEGATLTVQNSTFTDNTSNRAGGAIEDNSKAGTTVEVVGSVFTTNSTGSAPGNGGAIHITGDGDMTIATSIFNLNTAAAEGGAVWNGLGIMTIDNSEFNDNESAGLLANQGAGALYNLGGQVIVRNSDFTNNIASGLAGSGGAILNDTEGTLEVVGGSFTNNQSNRAGGAIEDNSGTGSVTISGSEFTNNSTASAPGNGGAFHITGGGNSTISEATFSGNTASSEGGALWNGTGVMNISGSMFMNNTASGPGADQGGGAIYLLSNGSAGISSSTFSNNVADGASGSGGAILVDLDAQLTVEESEFNNNSSMRAGGAIEDNSRSESIITISTSSFSGNSTAMMPGNGGAIHITGPGNMDISESNFTENIASAEGGAVWNGLGIMNLSSSNFIGNSANGAGADQGGGAVYNLGGTVAITGGDFNDNTALGTSGSGGAILNDTEGILSVVDASFTGNLSSRAGGAIEDNSGASSTIVIDGTDFEMNETGSAPGNGGAIHITGAGDADITDCTFTENIASAEGGAFWNGLGNSTVANSIFLNNIASGNDADQGGGAIYNLGGGLAIAQSGFSGNIADGTAGSGGAILNDTDGELSVNGSTFNENISNRAGGAIEDRSGAVSTLSITESTFISNETGSAPGNGGAIHITGNGGMEIGDCEFDSNIAASEGGAVWNGTSLMTISNSIFSDNSAGGADANQGGGALYLLNGGTVNITDSEFTGNAATGTAGSGGAILVDSSASLSVMNSLFDGNNSNRAGGAIEDNSKTSNIILISSSEFYNNETGSAPGNGGAIHITGPGFMNISDCIAEDNIAAREGGAFWNGSGEMNISNTRMQFNTASGASADDGGGSLWNNGGTLNVSRSSITQSFADGADGKGAGVYNANGELRIENSTISGNIANGNGGGIYSIGSIILQNNTIAFNNAVNGGGIAFGDAEGIESMIQGNIIASNISENDQDIFSSLAVASDGFNLIGIDDDMVFSATSDDFIGNSSAPIDANLAPAADNGGSTITHNFAGPSLAVDNANPDYNELDQINQEVFNSRRDIGAFECQDCDELPDAINELDGLVSVFPNPVSGNNLTVQFDGEANLSLLTIDGKLVIQKNLNGSLQLNLSNLPSGQYQLKVTSGNATSVKSIMKL